jgi:glycerol-3-phosphate dehydrogenase
MTRDLDQLTGRTFDLVVVGGGIYGLAIAYDAAQRGLAVALVERNDFGSGASFNHLRTLHGGLRYLQTFDLARSRESMRERRTFGRIAPHAIRPTPFALPLYRSLTRGKIAMRIGFLLDRIVSMGRNRGVSSMMRLPGGRVVSRSTAIQQYPGLRRQGLTGAAVWHDYVMTEPDRLTFSFALAAVEHGAVVINHVEATTPIVEQGRVKGVAVRDGFTGREIEVSGRVVVNAAGGDVEALLKPLNIAARIPMLRQMNLVTRRDAGEEALGGRSTSGRNLFLVPWRERAVFGTWESGRAWDPADTTVAEADVTAFIGELNQAFPALDLSIADVTLVHRGLVPAARRGDRVVLEPHEQIRDHGRDGADGLITAAGTKYTTARATAERVTDRVLAKLGRPAVPCRTAATVLPGGAIRDVGLAIADGRREHDAGLPSDTIPHLIGAYGSRFRDVLDVAADRPDWRTRIAHESPVIGAQLVHAARREMAVTLGDVVLRRTPLGALGDPGPDALARAAAIVGGELGWTDERQREEIAAVRAFYGTLNALKT